MDSRQLLATFCKQVQETFTFLVHSARYQNLTLELYDSGAHKGDTNFVACPAGGVVCALYHLTRQPLPIR